MSFPRAIRRPKLVTTLIETFGFSPWLASMVACVMLFLAAAALVWLFLSAPPRSVTMATGPAGSSFERYALKYKEELAKSGVTLKIVPTDGALDNLHHLTAPGSGVDVGFVQDGLVGEHPPPGVVSLGSVSYQPLWVFYRGTSRMELLSGLAGQRIGIGAPDSGVNALARALLDANKILGAPTVLDEQPSERASEDFMKDRLDAIFLMGDSAPTSVILELLKAQQVQVYSFTQADAYVRRLATLSLNKIVVPEGAIDLGHDLPLQDLTLVGPTVELVAREGLNSAISDLLLDIAQRVHGRATVLAKRGEFPSPLERDFPISSDALRFYKSGKGITYKLVDQFWLASLINRLLVAFVPMLLVLIPTVRFFPVLYRWSVQLRIYRCYRPLLRLERDAGATLTAERVKELLRALDTIEQDVNALKVPASFASQFYDLRNHVVFVRNRLKAAVAA